MSRFQTSIIIRTLIICFWWWFFAYNILAIWWFWAIQWSISIFLIWLWMWWKQQGIGFLAVVSCCITAINYIFTIIPVYNTTPSLDMFLASQVPSFVCIPETSPTTITINNSQISIKELCDRKNYPVYLWQNFSRSDTWSLIIQYGDSTSTYIIGPAQGSVTRSAQWVYTTILSVWTGSYYDGNSNNYAAHPLQYFIANNFFTAKKQFLQTNFPWVRENAPLLTEVALWKMRILSILDRSYSEKIKNLMFYMSNITKK